MDEPKPFTAAELDEIEKHLDDESEWQNIDEFWGAWGPRINNRLARLIATAKNRVSKETKENRCMFSDKPCEETAIEPNRTEHCTCLHCMAWLYANVPGFEVLGMKRELEATRKHLESCYMAMDVSQAMSRPLSHYIRDWKEALQFYADQHNWTHNQEGRRIIKGGPPSEAYLTLLDEDKGRIAKDAVANAHRPRSSLCQMSARFLPTLAGRVRRHRGRSGRCPRRTRLAGATRLPRLISPCRGRRLIQILSC